MDIKIVDEFIKLQQAMQLAGLCGSGAEAKYEILEGKVSVNGEAETRRGKKLRNGDFFEYKGEKYFIKNAD